MYRLAYISLFLICKLGVAQQPVSIHLTEKDGLPDKEFYGVDEDSKGFIWLAGNSGLSRYDGTDFKTYSHPEKRGISVFELNIDLNDRVWCVNISGQVFYVEDEKMHLFADLQKDLNGLLPDMKIINNDLILTTYRTTHIFNTITKKLVKYYPHVKNEVYVTPTIQDKSLVYKHLDSFYTIENNDAAVATKFPAVFLQDGFKNRSKFQSLSWNDKLIILEQSLHRESKLHVLTERNKTTLSIPQELSNSSIGKLIHIDNELWFITGNGVYICYVKNNELLIKQHLISGIFSTAVVKDRDDNYWISTLDSGVFIIPNIHINQLQLPQLLGAPSKTIRVPDGKLLIGFKNGKALEYKIQDGTIRNLKTNSSFPVSALFYDSYRKEYLVIQKIDNFRFNANTLEPSSNSNLISVKNLMLIHKDSMMSVSSQHGRVSYYPKAGVDIASYSSIFMEKRGYSCMHDHRTGDRYFGMVDELAVYNTKNKKTIKYKGKNLLAKSIILGKDAGIWVATFSNGIFYIQQDRVVKHYDTNDGLLSDMVEQIALDGIYLWVVTKKGIQKFNTISGSFQNLTRRDGVLSYDISDIIVEKNYVVFSSNDGLFSIDKERAFKKFRPLDVYLTSVEINEQRQEILPFYELERDHSKLRISFNSNGYRGTSSGSYEYRMLGLEKKWNKVENGTNQITYGNLPQGNFTFQLKATEAAVRSNPLTSIELSVFVAFYEQWWFWTVIAISLLALVVVYYKRKLRFRESEKNNQLLALQKEKEMVNLKLENLRSQMNPHFVFNALNSIQEYIMKNQRAQAGDYLGKFADLIRTYLNQSVKGRITLQEEIDSLNMYLELEQLRFEERLQYSITASIEEKSDHFYIPTMLIQPYVENALKHGLLHIEGERLLTITFTQDIEKHRIICRIDDNGVGREKSKEIQSKRIKPHKSFATKATDDRISLLNYVLEKEASIETIDKFNGDNATGTLVTIKIPYTTEA